MFTSAISGIDQALWDLKGKLLGVPVSALLGGPREARVPVYAHFHGDTMRGAHRGRPAPRRRGLHRRQVEHDRLDRARARASAATSCARSTRSTTRCGSALGDDVHLMDDAHAVYDAPSGARGRPRARAVPAAVLRGTDDPRGPRRLRAASVAGRPPRSPARSGSTSKFALPRLLQGGRRRRRPARHRLHRRHHGDEEGRRDRRALPGRDRARTTPRARSGSWPPPTSWPRSRTRSSRSSSRPSWSRGGTTSSRIRSTSRTARCSSATGRASGIEFDEDALRRHVVG